MNKARIEIFLGIFGAILGLAALVVSVLSYNQSSESLKLSRASEERAKQAQIASQRIEVNQLLSDAWDLLGGEVGSTVIQNPTRDEGKLELARRLIQDRAMVLEPKNSTAHRYYGVYLYAKGDLRGAMQAFQRAVGLNPSDKAALFNLARMKMEVFGVIK